MRPTSVNRRFPSAYTLFDRLMNLSAWIADSLGGVSESPTRLPRKARADLSFETLECRVVPTVAINYDVLNMSRGATDWTSSPSGGYTPDQIRTAYGISSITVNGHAGNGSGQTIAIIDPYDDPDIAADLATFDSTFGTSSNQLNARSVSTFFSKVNESGGSTLPGVDPTGAAEIEESIDVEWAHAIAPEANILLVECNSINPSDMFAGAKWAGESSGASVVSMSFGYNEASNEYEYDSDFMATGVTYLAAAGDDSTTNDGPQYPAASPNVVAVGGTCLTLNSNNTINTETVWNDLSDPVVADRGATAGGDSAVERIPTYQSSVSGVIGSYRGVPDVVFEAGVNYNTGTGTYTGAGVDICDSYNGGATPWGAYGGTSLATPCWAGLISIANQERNSVSLPNLSGESQTLPYLYSMPESNFHDITTGSTTSTYGTFNAGIGYDLASGRGSPNAPQIVLTMVNNPVLFPSGGATTAEWVGNNINSFSIGSNGYMYTDSVAVTENGSNTNFSGMVPVDPYDSSFVPGKAVAAAFYGGSGSETVVLSVINIGIIEYDIYNGTSWSYFVTVSSSTNFTGGEQIAVVANSADTFTLYAATTTGGIESSYYNGGTWGSFTTLASAGAVADGAALSITPAFSGGDMVLAAIGAGGVMKYDLYNGSSWSGIANVNSSASFAAGARVGLSEFGNNEIAAFATTTTGAIYGASFNGSSWTNFSTLASAGTFADGGAVTAELVNVSIGSVDLFAVNKSGVMEEDMYISGTWSGFKAVSSASDFSPGASVCVFSFWWVPYSQSDLFVFTDATNGEQNADYYNQINTTWSGFFALGGGY
jgi:hypothetical protein